MAKLFLAPSWSWGGFRLNKFQIRDPVFPEIWKNRFWWEIIKYFYKNYSNFHVKNRQINSDKNDF